jgi:hypothetical protein
MSVKRLLVLAAIGVPALALPADAGCYVRKVVKTAVAPVAVFVPTYAAAYTPAAVVPAAPVAPAVAAPAAAAVQAPAAGDLAAVLQRIEQRLGALERQVPPPAAEPLKAPAAPKKGGALQSAAAKCVACHGSGNESKGGGLVLTDGRDFRDLDAPSLQKLARHLSNQTMPPKSSGMEPLTTEELLAVAERYGLAVE